MSNFNEDQHDKEVFAMEMAIDEAGSSDELSIIESNIKDYKIKYKLLHYSWCINENVKDLKSKLNEKRNEIKNYEYKQ